MNRRFMLSADNGDTWQEVFPAGAPVDNLIEWSRDKASGRATMRKELGGSVVFYSQANPSQYGKQFEIFKTLEETGDLCDPLLLKLELKCGSEWVELFQGEFAKGGGEWDYRKCRFQVKPEPNDRFACMEQAWDIKQNILQVAPVEATARITASIEIAACAYAWNGDPLNVTCTWYCHPDVELSDPTDCEAVPVNQWWLGYGGDDGPSAQQIGSIYWPPPLDVPAGVYLAVYWRERISTECVAGAPVSPPGAGWELLAGQDNCATTGMATWVRQPTFAWPYGPAVAGTCVDGVPTPPETDCTVGWTLALPCGATFGPSGSETTFPPYYVCLISEAPTSLPRARTLQDVLQYLLDQTGCGEIQGVRSDFFEINPPGDAPGYSAGINYVSGQTNPLRHLVLVQNSDAINPTASEPATIGEMSLKRLLGILKVKFRAEWDIDADGYLRLEHYSYWRSQQILDVMNYKRVEALVHRHDQSSVPRVERLNFAHSLSRDFVGKDIIYSGPCVGRTTPEIEHSAGEITTDISYVLGDPDAISKKGFVMLATVFDGSTYSTILDYGAISGNLISNAPLSTANLMRDYWTWDRLLPTGNMNGQSVTFDGFVPNRSQAEITIQCFECDALDFTGDGTVRTELGDIWGGIRGQVEKATLQANGHLRLSLRYSR